MKNKKRKKFQVYRVFFLYCVRIGKKCLCCPREDIMRARLKASLNPLGTILRWCTRVFRCFPQLGTHDCRKPPISRTAVRLIAVDLLVWSEGEIHLEVEMFWDDWERHISHFLLHSIAFSKRKYNYNTLYVVLCIMYYIYILNIVYNRFLSTNI